MSKSHKIALFAKMSKSHKIALFAKNEHKGNHGVTLMENMKQLSTNKWVAQRH